MNSKVNPIGAVLLYGVLVFSTSAFAVSVPDPNEIVRSASVRLSDTSSISVHAEKLFDVILGDGTKVQYSGAVDIWMIRAKGVFIDYGDDLGAKRFWYDGRSATLLDTLKNLYVTGPVEGDVATALERISVEHGIEMPLAPLLRDSVLDDLESLSKASYLGIHDAIGEPCHHLLFRGENADVQIWITAEGKPVFRKLVITFWTVESAPQQTLIFTDWEFDADIDPQIFRAELPEGAVAIPFLPTGGE